MSTHRIACRLSVDSAAPDILTDCPEACPCDSCCTGGLVGECKLAKDWELGWSTQTGLVAWRPDRRGQITLSWAAMEDRWGKEEVKAIDAWLEHCWWWRKHDADTSPEVIAMFGPGRHEDSTSIPAEYRVPPKPLVLPVRERRTVAA